MRDPICAGADAFLVGVIDASAGSCTRPSSGRAAAVRGGHRDPGPGPRREPGVSVRDRAHALPPARYALIAGDFGAMARTASSDPPDPAAHRLSLEEARRIAVGAQLLDAERPTSLLGVVERLTFLQLDPTAAIAPSADLVAWSRLGNAYDPGELRQALDRDRTLYEHDADGPADFLGDLCRPAHLGDMAVWPRGETPGAPPGSRATRRSAATSSRCSATPARCPRATSPTPTSCRGRPGLDEQPERHPDARVPHDARRDRGLRPPGPAAAVGSR